MDLIIVHFHSILDQVRIDFFPFKMNLKFLIVVFFIALLVCDDLAEARRRKRKKKKATTPAPTPAPTPATTPAPMTCSKKKESACLQQGYNDCQVTMSEECSF